MKGTNIARPGGRIRLNFPMRSTIHAVCCGTNLIIVFAGKEGRWKYDAGTFESFIPIKPEFGALMVGVECRVRRCELLLMLVARRAREASAGPIDLLSAGELKARRAVTCNAVVIFNDSNTGFDC